MNGRTVDATTLQSWLDRGEAVLIDVREPAEHAAQSIHGAVSLPLGKVRLSALPAATGKKLVVHCRKGGRGGAACQKLLSEDPGLEIYNLEGGIEAWHAAGFPVASSGRFFLPLDRQVQLTIGLSLLVTSYLAYTIGPVFLLITAFLGAGLTVAGLTGFCGLAMLLARMPWNICLPTQKRYCQR